MRKPIFIGIANYIFPGLGYVLLGKRTKFGYLMMLGCAVQIIQLCIDPLPPYYIVYGSSPFSVALGILALFTVLVAFAYDAYTLAKNSSGEH